MRPFSVVAFAGLVVFGSGCTKIAPATDTPVADCTKAEQRCQFADGKIGLCTANALGCDAGGQCLVCMSLH